MVTKGCLSHNDVNFRIIISITILTLKSYKSFLWPKNQKETTNFTNCIILFVVFRCENNIAWPI